MNPLFALLQLAAATTAPVSAADPRGQAAVPRPDIELRATVRAESVTISQGVLAELSVRADPPLAQAVEVRRSQPAGAASYRGLALSIAATATIADPLAPAPRTGAEREPPGEP